MNLRESIYNSVYIISANKVRSFLTMLGIIIGIMSVIIIMSVGAGAQSLILNQVKSLGSNLIGVLPGKSEDDGPPASAMGVVITTLKNDDVDALLSPAYPSITAVTGYVKGADTITSGVQKTDTNFVGVTAQLLEVEDTDVQQGRFFSEDEEHGTARVAVIGSQVAEDLFDGVNPIGRDVKIKKVNFNIIGVMRERGVSGFQNQDNQIYVPITTAQKLLLGIDYVSFARLKVDTADHVESAMEYTRSILRDLHNIDNPSDDDFSVRSMAQGLDAITTITNALRFFLAAVASIALIVGGIGIMNIMLAAVQERTREIGLRKAIGAKNKHIVQQFLVETVMITFIGGMIGIISGIGISVLVAFIAQSMGYKWDLVISVSSILIGCIVSIGIGLMFGLTPARRASRLDPIEALRYD